MRRSLVLVAALAVAIPAAGQEMLSIQFFPVVARGAGLAGTQWVTDLTVHNPMSETVTVGLQFFPANQDNLFNPFFPNSITLEPGETIMVADVLQEMFGYTGDIKGGLVLVADPQFIPTNPEGTVVLGVTRTYNVGSAEGTYGQTVPSLIASLNVGWASSFITGARNDGDFRSNLGIGSSSVIAPIRVYYRIMGPNGGVLVEGSKVIRVSSMNQWSFDQLGVGTVDGPLTVELWLDPANASPDPCAEDIPPGFLAYVSKVDNGTGDAEFLTSAAMEPFLCWHQE
jgi:hypothetical protein